jgi:hypothetical protein
MVSDLAEVPHHGCSRSIRTAEAGLDTECVGFYIQNEKPGRSAFSA